MPKIIASAGSGCGCLSVTGRNLKIRPEVDIGLPGDSVQLTLALSLPSLARAVTGNQRRHLLSDQLHVVPFRLSPFPWDSKFRAHVPLQREPLLVS
jgi:hypothetical protein